MKFKKILSEIVSETTNVISGRITKKWLTQFLTDIMRTGTLGIQGTIGSWYSETQNTKTSGRKI